MTRNNLKERTKNIQIIDGALNCTYSIYCVSEDKFNLVFPEEGQDIEFAEDFDKRLDSLPKETQEKLYDGFWGEPVDKKKVRGIHGTIFFELGYKKEYYPTKRDDEMVTVI